MKIPAVNLLLQTAGSWPRTNLKTCGTRAVSDEEFSKAAKGTVQNGRMVHTVGDEVYSTPIRSLRGDRKGRNGETITDIRPWEKGDFAPRPSDLFQERLYAI